MEVLQGNKMARWLDCHVTRSLPVLCTVIVAWLLQFAVVINANTTDADFSSLSSEPPKITEVHVGKGWERISIGGESTPRSVYSKTGDDLFLSCTAKYPIQWNISGIITPPEIVKIQPPKRDLKRGSYQIGVNIFFVDAANYSALAASATIACEQVGNAEIRDEISVFLRGSNRNSMITPWKSDLESDEVRMIPCATTDPKSTKPTLYHRENQTSRDETMVQNVVYNPTAGFKYADGKVFEGGIYNCRRHPEFVTINVIDSRKAASLSAPSDIHFAPITSNVSEFSDGFLEFACSSSKLVQLFHKAGPEISIAKILNLDNSKKNRLTVNDTATSPNNPILTGQTICVEAGSEKPVKQWNWKFVQPPQLYIDNLEGEADCLSDVTPKSVQTVRCKNAMDCKFMETNCLRNKSSCNFKKQKQFYADKDTYCFEEERQKGHPCVSVPFSHLNGVVKCKVMELERRWNFFISLDYTRYTDSKNANLRELVRIDEISEDDHENPASTKYVCTASAFLFADSLAFEIHYRNGTSVLIQDVKPINSTQGHKKSRQILELNVKAVLDKERVSSDAVSLDCLAPLWNHTDVLRATKYLGSNTNRFAPQLVAEGTPESQGNSQTIMRSEKFYIGELNRRLNCTFNGENETSTGKQTPSWIYKEGDGTSKGAKAAYPELVTGIDDDDGTEQHYLEFSKVEKKYGGEYYCVIFPDETNKDSNELMVTESSINTARALAKYKLDVSAEPLPTSTTVYVGLTILVLVIVGLAIAAFAVFAQKRNDT